MMNERRHMQPCDRTTQASLYALGLLEPPEAGEFELHLRSCATCEAEVRLSGGLAVELAEFMPVSDPPAYLRARVLSEAVLPRGVVAMVRGTALHWEPEVFPGVSLARLYQDAATGELATLVRMSPGACYPSHRHGGVEHCYVIEGDVIFADHKLHAGDYSAGAPGREHSSATTDSGCLLFIVTHTRDQVHSR
jgi:anti-sigma factor ChrR (cupin superfamily)